MADKTINQLTVSSGLTDDGLLVVYQDGETQSIAGSLIKEFAEAAVTPTVTVSDITGGHRITITDKNGTQTVDVMDGEDGYTPVKGTDYFDGTDGVSPTATVEAITGGHRVSITDVNGTQSLNIMDGEDGVSPTIAVATIVGGYRLTITDASGSKSIDVMNGEGAGDMTSAIYDPQGKAQDVFAYADAIKDSLTTESWTFTLEDGSTVTKGVYVE